MVNCNQCFRLTHDTSLKEQYCRLGCIKHGVWRKVEVNGLFTGIRDEVKFGYLWLWKVLFTWDRLEWSVSYYPDYENCKYRYTKRLK